MNYHGLVKRLNLTIGSAGPTELTYGDIRASALMRDHLYDDVLGIKRQPRTDSSNTRRPLADPARH